MRVTNIVTNNNSLMNMSRNMKNLQGIYEQSATGKVISRPSQDPLISSRAMRFRTQLAGIHQYQLNVESGHAWMNVTEASFFNLLRGDSDGSIFGGIIDDLLRVANDTNPLDVKDAMITSISNLMKQISLEMNQTYAGRFVFSGWRTDQPPVLTRPQQGISHVVTQTFNIKDIEQTSTFQRFPAGYPGTNDTGMAIIHHNVNILKLPYRQTESGTDISFANPSANLGAPTGIVKDPTATPPTYYNVVRKSLGDVDAYDPPDDGDTIHYIAETGELVFGDDVRTNFQDGTQVTYEVSNLQAGDLNPLCYFDSVSQLTRFSELNRFLPDNAGIWGSAISGMSSNTFALESPVRVTTPYQMEQTGLSAVNGAIRLAYGNITGLTVTDANGAGVNVQNAAPPPWTGDAYFDQATGVLHINPGSGLDFSNVTVNYSKNEFDLNDMIPTSNPNVTVTNNGAIFSGHYPMENQPINYDFSQGTSVQVNTMAKDVLTDKLFADLQRLIDFANSLSLPDQRELEQVYSSPPHSLEGEELKTAVEKHMADEAANIRNALSARVENMIRLMDDHTLEATREHTHLGSRMRQVEILELRLEESDGNISRLQSENEDADMAWVLLKQRAAESAFQQALRGIAANVQITLLNFI